VHLRVSADFRKSAHSGVQAADTPAARYLGPSRQAGEAAQRQRGVDLRQLRTSRRALDWPARFWVLGGAPVQQARVDALGSPQPRSPPETVPVRRRSKVRRTARAQVSRIAVVARLSDVAKPRRPDHSSGREVCARRRAPLTRGLCSGFAIVVGPSGVGNPDARVKPWSGGLEPLDSSGILAVAKSVVNGSPASADVEKVTRMPERPADRAGV